ncbi:MAG: DUF308 domain-containing protein [Bacteroidales bacterium]|jgi:uncharacterized membrane protein HdeD (DUF308 family)|nr:DUF308 domain-containing protein [Bacteroidales bacterium]
MEKQPGSKWYLILLRGIILTALSFFVLFNPEDTLKTVAFYLGIGFFIMGILLVIRGIPKRKEEGDWNWDILEGIGDLILGFLLIVVPMLLVAIIPILIGIWAGLYGFKQVADAVRAKKNILLQLLTGILIIILSLILIFKPLLLGLTVAIWLGVLLLVAGIYNIYYSIRLRQDQSNSLT